MNIDNVLVSLGMGRYQFVSCALFGIMTLYSNVSPIAYVFTAGDLKYRCEIPGCDSSNPVDQVYEPVWLPFTTPYKRDTGLPYSCKRYAMKAYPVNGTRCAPDEFDEHTVERCYGHWVFEDRENTVGTEFELMCEENKWKLSMVGSLNNVGQFIGIPVSGIIADKFGRKFAMVFCAVTSATLSIVQSFSVDYTMFLVLELLSSIVSSGIYTVTFILAMEMVVPKQRVLYYSILECFYPLGSLLVALIASQVKDWRALLRISNVPGLLFLSYFWLTEESMRWQDTQGKHDGVVNTLKRIARVNKKTLPDFSTDLQMETTNDDENVKYIDILKDVIRSPTLFWRTAKCSFIWIAITLVFYGLSINAVDIAGNKYVNFALVSFVEIPACLLNWLITEWTSRKKSLASMFVLSGFTCVVYNLTPSNLHWTKLSLFMVSKLGISVAFTVVYMLTAEIFPTQMRATLLAMCSMIGRIGSMLAPQTTLLTEFFGEYVTMLVFGGTSLLAAAVTTTLPESKNIELPDTVDDAERIGVTHLLCA